MRESLNIKGIGEVAIAPPRSLVAVNDLVTEYSGTKSRAKLARLSAALVGICWSRSNARRAPVYDVMGGEVIAYGAEMLEWLMGEGADLASLYTATRPVFLELWGLLPKVEEVEAAADYFPGEGRA